MEAHGSATQYTACTVSRQTGAKVAAHTRRTHTTYTTATLLHTWRQHKLRSNTGCTSAAAAAVGAAEERALGGNKLLRRHRVCWHGSGWACELWVVE